MKVILVVNRFPVISESFVLRTAEMIVDHLGARVTIIALSGYNEKKLKEVFPDFMGYISCGRVEMIGGPFFSYFKALSDFSFFMSKSPSATFKAFASVARFILSSNIRIKYAVKAICLANYLEKNDDNEVVIVQPQFLSLGVICSIASNFLQKRRVDTVWSTVCHIRGSDISAEKSVSIKDIAYLRDSPWAPSLFLASCESLKKMAVERGLKEESIKVLYSPLSTFMLPWRKAAEYSSDRAIVLIQVGRLVEKKGARMSIKALSSLADFHCRLEFVGDGPERRDLERLAKASGVADRVVFLGALPQSQTLARICNADILLVPSLVGRNGDSEGIPNVIKEAMALGTLVVASDHAGAPEILENGSSGYLFSEGNQSSFVDALNKALTSRAEWPRILEKAREVVVTRFDYKKISHDLYAYYRSLGYILPPLMSSEKSS